MPKLSSCPPPQRERGVRGSSPGGPPAAGACSFRERRQACPSGPAHAAPFSVGGLSAHGACPDAQPAPLRDCAGAVGTQLCAEPCVHNPISPDSGAPALARTLGRSRPTTPPGPPEPAGCRLTLVFRAVPAAPEQRAGGFPTPPALKDGPRCPRPGRPSSGRPLSSGPPSAARGHDDTSLRSADQKGQVWKIEWS